MMKQLFNGFRAMNEFNAIHGNIELPNILFNKGELKIADFGLSEKINEIMVYDEIFPTYFNMAPEIIEEKKYLIKADIYSLGVIFY